eukprot:1363081-Rhodomonas_salina.1
MPWREGRARCSGGRCHRASRRPRRKTSAPAIGSHNTVKEPPGKTPAHLLSGSEQHLLDRSLGPFQLGPLDWGIVVDFLEGFLRWRRWRGRGR